MLHERLSGLSSVSIECDMLKDTDINEVIKDFLNVEEYLLQSKYISEYYVTC